MPKKYFGFQRESVYLPCGTLKRVSTQRMPLNLHTDLYASGKVPRSWVRKIGGTLKCPVRNQAVYRELRRLAGGRWRKAIKQGNSGEVHYFEHESGRVAGVKYFPKA
ncbi:hypothetical protein HUU05_16325 [candidate division KSB1 bacterium]|nr:hypothetical protein [candidate division KSB1 bacterium]